MSPLGLPATVTAALSPQVETQRIAALKPEPPLTEAERLEMVRRFMRWLFR
jgi:hypothetical protein